MTDSATGVRYTDNGKGNFESAEGEVLQPGWKAFVGLTNYATAVGSTGQAEIVGVFAWTFIFALLSVVLSFGAGTFLALVFNDPRLRFRRIYRVLMILPYAFPIFLSGLVWSGLLNQQYGFINQVLLGGATVPWLQDPMLARATVILVSVWFGAPYFFLVCTGALQAIPEDVQQAARVDGASPWQVFRLIKLPLLLISVSPLLIAAFAFSFNDFGTIFMLSGGGPSNPTSPIGAGATDILITVVYKLAFLPGQKDYGLASAFAVIIFAIVSIISLVLFRRTKSLEEIY
jgi:arabinogalactan oligomer/maltooligosaccharide transport system permease protein